MSDTLNIEFDAVHQGTGSDDNDWPHNLWRVTLTVDGRTFTTDYRMGLGLLNYEPIRRSGDRYKAEQARTIKYNHFGPGKDAVTSPKAPTRHEVLASLALDCQAGDQLFEDFCGDFGYDVDSRKAHQTWEACQKMHYELRNLFGYAGYQKFIETDWEEEPCSSD